MMDFYGCYFKYGTFDSSTYKLAITNIETSRITILQASQNINTVHTRRNNMHLLTRVTYDEAPISFEMEITTIDGSIIEDADVPVIESALFNKKTFTKLYTFSVCDDEYVEPTLFLNCLFTEGEMIEVDGGIVGYKVIITMDSVMAWEDAQTQSFTLSGSTNTCSVNVDSDINDYIYPVVSITTGGSGGNISIYNNSDDATRFTSFTGVPANTTFFMDSTTNHLSNLTYSYFNDRNYIRLLNGENNFYITGNVISISFTFNNRKFL